MLEQDRRAEFTMKRSGMLQGFLIWVEVLPEGSGGPVLNSLECLDISWSPMLLSLPRPIHVSKGDMLRCSTLVLPATSEGPKLFIDMPWPRSSADPEPEGKLRFQWDLEDGARWILPGGSEVSFVDQAEYLLSPEQEFLWELFGPPAYEDG